MAVKQICQERVVSISHTSPGSSHIAAKNAKVFTKLDAIKGYHQCHLEEESQLPSLAGSSSYKPLLASCLSLNIIIDRWTKPSLACQAIAVLWMILLRCSEKGISLNAENEA